MASIHLRHEWPDGESIEITVKAATSFPDALNEARATAMSMLRDVFALTRVGADEPDAT